jgi:hypothetical protein
MFESTRPKPKAMSARRRKRMNAQVAKVADAAMAAWLNPPKRRTATDAEVRYFAKAFEVPVSKVRPK